MVSIPSRLVLLRAGPFPRVRFTAVLLGGALFGLAVALAGALLAIEAWGILERAVITLAGT